MFDKAELNTYAILIDGRGRFVDCIGRVVGTGDILRIEDGHRLECYEHKTLSEAIVEAGLSLVFLPPAVRLPTAPAQIRDKLYRKIATARLALSQ